MRIAISGSTGMIGNALIRSLTKRGHRTLRLVRQESTSVPQKGPMGMHIPWNPRKRWIDRRMMEGLDAVVHLAGEPIAQRWNNQVKQRIRDSRVQSTRLLAETLAELRHRPRALICASAVGFYGDRGDAWLDEQAPPGSGFLAEIAREWEAAADATRESGIRTVHARLGIVLSRDGGALRQMLPIFRLGLGGPLGHGRQYMSWITLRDTVEAIEHLLIDKRAIGPVNLCTANPVTNLQFTEVLGRALKRPVLLTVPAFALRLVWGEMADQALLPSVRCTPKKLQDMGFQFSHPLLPQALFWALRG